MENLAYFLFLISLIIKSVLSNEDSSEFHIGETKEESYNSTKHFYHVTLLEPKEDYLVIEVEPENGTESDIYASKIEKYPGNLNSDFQSALKGIDVISIPQKYYEDSTAIYVCVECNVNCHYKIKIYYQKFQEIHENSIQYYLTGSLNNTGLFHFIKPRAYTHRFILFAMAGHADDLSMKVEYVFSKTISKDIDKHQAWYNGYAAVVKGEDFLDCEQCYFKIEVISKPKSYVAVGMKVLTRDARKLASLDNVFGYLEKTDIDCYDLVEKESYYIITAQSFLQNAQMYLSDSSANNISFKSWEIKDSVSFKMSSTELANRILCFKSPMDGATSYSLQITKESDIEQGQAKHMPLVNGIPVYGYLPPRRVTYYRPWKYTQKTKEFNMNLKVMKGNPKLYGYICESFPYCIFDQEKIDASENNGVFFMSQDVNDNYHVTIENEDDFCGGTYQDSCQFLAIVYCKGEAECEYIVSVNTEKDYVMLFENEKFSKYVLKSEEDYFRIKITDASIQKLTIVLYSLNGDADLSSKDEVSAKAYCMFNIIILHVDSSVGNRETIEYFNEQAKANETNSLVGDYYITVNGVSNAFYTVYYYSQDKASHEDTAEIEIESGVIVIETLSKSENTKTFKFLNRNSQSGANFLVTFHSLNCQVEISHPDSTLLPMKNSHAQYLVTTDDPIYRAQVYPFKVKFIQLNSGSESPSEQCMLYLGGNEMIPTRELVLNEGTPHYVTLDSMLKKITYDYPHIYSKESIIIAVELDIPAKVNISLGIEGKYSNKDTYTITKSTKMILSKDSMENICIAKNLCNIFITIELSEENVQCVTVKLYIKSNNKVPSYIEKNMIKVDSIFPNALQYYYTDIKQDEKGEVVLNIKKGSGVMFGKIVRKDAREEQGANWQKRVRLPTREDQSHIYYDYFNRKLIYNSTDTKNCDNGCELYIGVESTEKHFHLDLLTEYSIFIKNTILTLSPNEPAHGSLSSTILMREFEYDYYTFTVPIETDRIYVQLSSKTCLLFVNSGCAKLPSKEYSDWEFMDYEGFLTIHRNDPKIASQLKGKQFTFAVASKGLEGIFTSAYSIMVIVPNEKISPIFELSSDDNALCEIESDGGYCDFYITVRDFDKIQRILLYTAPMSHENAMNSFAIYSNIISATEYEALKPEEAYTKRPREGACTFSSSQQFQSDYLLIPDNYNFHTSTYVLISVHARNKGLISLMASWRTDIQSMLLSPTNKKLVHLQRGTSIEFSITGQGAYYLEVYRIFGRGTVRADLNEYKIDDKMTSLGVVFLKSEQSIVITAVDDFGFHVYYDKRPTENMDDLIYGRYNYILYHKNSFPVMYSFPVENEDMDVTVNFRIIQAEVDVNAPGEGDDDLTITGFFSDDDFIQHRARDKNAMLIYKKVISGQYDRSLGLGQLTYYSSDIKGYVGIGKKQLLIIVEKSTTNMLNYSSFMTQVIAFPVSSVSSLLVLPQHYYLTSNIVRKDILKVNQITAWGHVYKLSKKKVNENYMLIELSFCSENVGFAIRPYKEEEFSHLNQEIFTNSTDVDIISSRYSFGIQRIEVKLSEHSSGLMLSIFPNTTCQKEDDCIKNLQLSFAVKYNTHKNIHSAYEIQNNGAIAWRKTSNEDLNLEWGRVRTTADNQQSPVKYNSIIRVLPRSSFISQSDLFSICILANRPWNVYKITHNSTSENLPNKFTIPNFPKEGEWHVSIIATINEKDDDETLLVYTPFQVESPDYLKGWSPWIIVLLVVLSIVFLILLVYFYRKYKQMKLQIEYSNASNIYGKITTNL